MKLSKIQFEITQSIKGIPLQEDKLPEKNFIYFYNSFFNKQNGLIKYVAKDFSWFVTSFKNKEFAKFDYRKNSTTKGFYIKAGLPFKYHSIEIFQYSDEQIFKMLKYYPMPHDLNEKFDLICNFANSPHLASTMFEDN